MIYGEKVRLRAPEPTDAERFYRWINDPAVTHHLGMRFPLSLAAERKWAEQERDPRDELVLVIETLQGEAIGTCALGSISALDRNAGLGISIGEKDYWSQGYGTDAMLTLCGFGFRQMSLHRIWLHVFADNTRAVRCYEKCGFQHEGRLREAVFRHGGWHDLLVMALLEEEYRDKWPQRWEEEG